MQVFGYLTLGLIAFILIEQEINASNPCSQFSSPSLQSMCTTDNYPMKESYEE
jgi:hypothetical protein